MATTNITSSHADQYTSQSRIEWTNERNDEHKSWKQAVSTLDRSHTVLLPCQWIQRARCKSIHSFAELSVKQGQIHWHKQLLHFELQIVFGLKGKGEGKIRCPQIHIGLHWWPLVYCFIWTIFTGLPFNHQILLQVKQIQLYQLPESKQEWMSFCLCLFLFHPYPFPDVYLHIHTPGCYNGNRHIHKGKNPFTQVPQESPGSRDRHGKHSLTSKEITSLTRR